MMSDGLVFNEPPVDAIENFDRPVFFQALEKVRVFFPIIGKSPAMEGTSNQEPVA
jgi:hypothetical protein